MTQKYVEEDLLEWKFFLNYCRMMATSWNCFAYFDLETKVC